MNDIERKIAQTVQPRLDQIIAELKDTLRSGNSSSVIMLQVVEHMKGRSSHEFQDMLAGLGCAFVFRLLDEIEAEI